MLVISALRFWRRPSAELEPELDEDLLDVPAFQRRNGEWKSGLRDVRLRPLEWVGTPPMRPGFFHARLPGAAGFTIVQVAHDEQGVLVYGMPAVAWRPVIGSELEWSSCAIQDPRP